MIEVIQHLMTCKTRAGVCRGREPIVRNIRRYVAGTSNQLMVVHGESGSGKTSVMAKASSLIRSWFTESDPVVIIRFLGEFDVKYAHIYCSVTVNSSNRLLEGIFLKIIYIVYNI